MNSLGRKGFTLVEVLFAVLILGISLVSVGFLFSQGTAFMAGGIKEDAIATQAAQERIEAIRNMPFDSILLLGTTFTAAGLNNLNNATGTVAVTNPYGSNDIR